MPLQWHYILPFTGLAEINVALGTTNLCATCPGNRHVVFVEHCGIFMLP